MSEFDQELVDSWLTYAEAWLTLLEKPTSPLNYLLYLIGFERAMRGLREFWPTNE